MSYFLGQQANALKNFDITIDGIKLTISQIKSVKIKWNINNFKISGEIIYSDIGNIIENLPIRGENEVILSMKDFDDKISTQIMKVIDVEYTMSSSGIPTVKLVLLDPISIAAIQMYNEMSWKKESADKIIDHEETLKPLLVGKNKDFGSPNEKHENFVIPLNVSFNVVAHWLARHNNMMFFQNRTDFIFQPLNKLFSKGKKGDKFRYKTVNTAYRRRIYEYNVNMGKLLETNLFQPDAKVASFDIGNKHSKWTNETFKDALEEVSSKGSIDPKLTSTTNKHFYKSDYLIKDVVDFMWQKNSYRGLELEILVPGQFDTNIGDIVELDIVNYNKHTQPEANINGEWLIQEIVDVIRPPDFLQRITLARNKFSS